MRCEWGVSVRLEQSPAISTYPKGRLCVAVSRLTFRRVSVSHLKPFLFCHVRWHTETLFVISHCPLFILVAPSLVVCSHSSPIGASCVRSSYCSGSCPSRINTSHPSHPQFRPDLQYHALLQTLHCTVWVHNLIITRSIIMSVLEKNLYKCWNRF